eukprot:NODE_399_length_9361_cov_0.420428.p3 type:complete len:529 gc:universal NODE_399_length_9361_cov_0.420428:5590-4004(-)
MLILAQTIILAIHYCTPDKRLCIDIRAVSDTNVTISIDYSIALGTVIFSTLSGTVYSNILRLSPKNFNSSITILDSEKQFLNSSEYRFEMYKNTIVNDRGIVVFTKMLKTRFLTDLSINGDSIIIWSNSPDNVYFNGYKRLKSISLDGYFIDDTGYTKSHGYLTVFAFFLFLPISMIMRRWYSNHSYFYTIYYIETVLWTSVITSVAVIMYSTRNTSTSSHGLIAGIFLLPFLVSRTAMVLCTYNSFNALLCKYSLKNPPRQQKISISLYVDLFMITAVLCIFVIQILASFSITAYSILLGVLMFITFSTVLVLKFRIKPENKHKTSTSISSELVKHYKKSAGAPELQEQLNSPQSMLPVNLEFKDDSVIVPELKVTDYESDNDVLEPKAARESQGSAVNSEEYPESNDTESLDRPHFILLDTLERCKNKENVFTKAQEIAESPIELDEKRPATIRFKETPIIHEYSPQYSNEYESDNESLDLQDKETEITKDQPDGKSVLSSQSLEVDDPKLDEENHRGHSDDYSYM